MTVKIHVDSMKAAEQLSAICKSFSGEIFLRSDQYCVDAKSTLGILAIMYASRDEMRLDTGNLSEQDADALLNAVRGYIEQA